jgi:hypothetical protein
MSSSLRVSLGFLSIGVGVSNFQLPGVRGGHLARGNSDGGVVVSIRLSTTLLDQHAPWTLPLDPTFGNTGTCIESTCSRSSVSTPTLTKYFAHLSYCPSGPRRFTVGHISVHDLMLLCINACPSFQVDSASAASHITL